jgi:tetratricopeptide (TPR) repeat protein
MKIVVFIFFVLLVLVSIVAVLALLLGVLSQVRQRRAKSKRSHSVRGNLKKRMVSCRMLAEYHGGLRKATDRKLKLLFEKGLTLKKKGRFPSAITAFEECLKGNLTARQQAGVLVTTGNCHFAVDQLPSAEDCYRKAGLLSAESDDEDGRLSCLINLGLIGAADKRWDEAIANYHEAISLDQKLGQTRGEAIDLNTLGLLYENKGDLESALAHYTASQLIFRKLDEGEKVELVESNIRRIGSQNADTENSDSDQNQV